MDKVWKAMERKVARRFGGERIPGSGVQRRGPLLGDAIIPDPRFHIECKYRTAGFSVHGIYRDEEPKAKKLNRMLLLVTKGRGERGEFVTLKLEDFLTLVPIEGV